MKKEKKKKKIMTRALYISGVGICMYVCSEKVEKL